MFPVFRMVLGRVFRSVLTAVVLAPFGVFSANAATFNIDFSGGASTVLGTFDAPLAGGAVTNFSVTLSGVTFDTSTGAATTFTYNPVINEFAYTGGFASFTNSANNVLCPAGGCFLEIYPDPTPAIPGDYLAIDASLSNIDAGTKYLINPVPLIAPVPLPPALPVAFIALGFLFFLGKKYRRNETALPA